MAPQSRCDFATIITREITQTESQNHPKEVQELFLGDGRPTILFAPNRAAITAKSRLNWGAFGNDGDHTDVPQFAAISNHSLSARNLERQGVNGA